MDTKICYLYRDAGNYKVHNECVIQGELSKEQIQSILDCCDMGEYFIPRQVGMPKGDSMSMIPRSIIAGLKSAKMGLNAQISLRIFL